MISRRSADGRSVTRAVRRPGAAVGFAQNLCPPKASRPTVSASAKTPHAGSLPVASSTPPNELPHAVVDAGDRLLALGEDV